MVVLRLPSGAHQTEHRLRKRRPADAHRPGGRRPWHCRGSAGGADPARKGPCRSARAWRRANRQMANDCLASATVFGSVCPPFCCRTCGVQSRQLSQSGSHAPGAAHAETQGISELNVRVGSTCEKLKVSITLPVYSQEQTFEQTSSTAATCHSRACCPAAFKRIARGRSRRPFLSNRRKPLSPRMSCRMRLPPSPLFITPTDLPARATSRRAN